MPAGSTRPSRDRSRVATGVPEVVNSTRPCPLPTWRWPVEGSKARPRARSRHSNAGRRPIRSPRRSSRRRRARCGQAEALTRPARTPRRSTGRPPSPAVREGRGEVRLAGRVSSDRGRRSRSMLVPRAVGSALSSSSRRAWRASKTTLTGSFTRGRDARLTGAVRDCRQLERSEPDDVRLGQPAARDRPSDGVEGLARGGEGQAGRARRLRFCRARAPAPAEPCPNGPSWRLASGAAAADTTETAETTAAPMSASPRMRANAPAPPTPQARFRELDARFERSSAPGHPVGHTALPCPPPHSKSTEVVVPKWLRVERKRAHRKGKSRLPRSAILVLCEEVVRVAHPAVTLSSELVAEFQDLRGVDLIPR